MSELETFHDEDWEQTRQEYVSELLAFDPVNTDLVALLNSLLPKSDTQVC